MLLQTNSYIVPREKRADHARLMGRLRQVFARLGAELEVYEQTGPNFAGDGGGRFVQIMRFRDRTHQQQVHQAEKGDAGAQKLINDFCRLVNLPYQQQHGLFAAGYYVGVAAERPALRDARHEVPAGAAGGAAADESEEASLPGPPPGHEDADEATFGDDARDADEDHLDPPSR